MREIRKGKGRKMREQWEMEGKGRKEGWRGSTTERKKNTFSAWFKRKRIKEEVKASREEG